MTDLVNLHRHTPLSVCLVPFAIFDIYCIASCSLFCWPTRAVPTNACHHELCLKYRHRECLLSLFITAVLSSHHSLSNLKLQLLQITSYVRHVVSTQDMASLTCNRKLCRAILVSISYFWSGISLIAYSLVFHRYLTRILAATKCQISCNSDCRLRLVMSLGKSCCIYHRVSWLIFTCYWESIDGKP
jgi:hypothetical protein